MFRDRQDAGRQLGERLRVLGNQDPVVIGLPRGGVIVAEQVARALGAPLDVIVARKVGAPHNPELAVGAVAPGVVHMDDSLTEALQIPQDYLTRMIAHEQGEVRRREEIYRGGRSPAGVSGRIVILVDDGLATGSTAAAAIRSLRTLHPSRVILAVPVGAPETVRQLRLMVDDLVCLSSPPHFRAVGQAYEDFGQTTDEEVITALKGGGA